MVHDLKKNVMQFSSLSSVGNDDKYLRELCSSLGLTTTAPLPLRVVFPTEAAVRQATF